MKVPAALERYRIKAGGQASTDSRPAANEGELKLFVRAVRRALRSLTRAALEAAKDPRRGRATRISVKTVAEAAGKGRSQIYAAHPYLVAEIRDAARRVREAQAASDKPQPETKTKSQLQRELTAVRREASIQVRTIASTQLAQLHARLGPEFRRREKYSATIQELRKRLSEAEATKATLAEINKGLMIEANRGR